MGLFDRFTKGKKPVRESVPAPRMHPAISQLAKIYDSIHIQYELTANDAEWKLVAFLRTQAGYKHHIQFTCNNINRNDISIMTVIKAPLSAGANIPDSLLMLVNNFNRQYRYLRFAYDSDGYILIRYDLPCCTANPGAVAREIAQIILLTSDDLRSELEKAT